MTACGDKTNYMALRDDTRNKAAEHSASCTALATAEQALTDAQGAYDTAKADELARRNAWQLAEQAENAEASKLGIDPIGGQ